MERKDQRETNRYYVVLSPHTHYASAFQNGDVPPRPLYE